MIRARFKADADDFRPINWPVKHPYWCTGFGDDHSIVVAYADDEAEILRNWPEATDIESEERVEYTFTDRFPKPEWFRGYIQMTKSVSQIIHEARKLCWHDIKKAECIKCGKEMWVRSSDGYIRLRLPNYLIHSPDWTAMIQWAVKQEWWYNFEIQCLLLDTSRGETVNMNLFTDPPALATKLTEFITNKEGENG